MHFHVGFSYHSHAYTKNKPTYQFPTDVLLDGQLRINENVRIIQDEVYNLGAVPLIEKKTNRQIKVKEKSREYQIILLEKRRD